jgi:hypothetical protein
LAQSLLAQAKAAHVSKRQSQAPRQRICFKKTAAATGAWTRAHHGLRLMGWLTTTVMAVAAIIMCVTTMF